MKKWELGTDSFQTEATKYRNPSCWIQEGLNWNGMGPKLRSCEITKRIGLWSEALKGRMEESRLSPRSRRECWARHLSRRATICPGLVLLLDQVKIPLAGLMSSKSQSNIKSSTVSWRGSLIGVPPFFSGRKGWGSDPQLGLSSRDGVDAGNPV
jgi:hypothetical protein